MNLTKGEMVQISEILNRRANEIAGFKNEMMKDKGHLGSVELALTREIQRLRNLADKISPVREDDDE